MKLCNHRDHSNFVSRDSSLDGKRDVDNLTTLNRGLNDLMWNSKFTQTHHHSRVSEGWTTQAITSERGLTFYTLTSKVLLTVEIEITLEGNNTLLSIYLYDQSLV